MTVLILGGTGEARQLAQAMVDRTVIYSLSGATENPRLPANSSVRQGGFGGVKGLTAYLKKKSITHVIDATHPFAEQMSRHALAACSDAGIPLVRFERPAWQVEPGDYWMQVRTINRAFDEIAMLYKRPLLALGIKETAEFRQITGQTVFLRSFNEPTSLPPGWHWVPTERDSSLDKEIALYKILQIDVLVCRNSGGDRTKLDAARSLRLPVVMIERPVLARVETLSTIDEVIGFLNS